MIAHLKGQIVRQSVQKDHARMVLDVNGIGYEILVGLNALSKFPTQGTIVLSVFQSIIPYDGTTILYGFASPEEREIFIQLKEHVPGIGPKKALESLDRITKSLPDFRRAILEKDLKLLIGVFGFSRKTAEKLIYSLRDRVDIFAHGDREKWSGFRSAPEQEAVSALVALGYSATEAREVVTSILDGADSPPATPELLKTALKTLGSRSYGTRS